MIQTEHSRLLNDGFQVLVKLAGKNAWSVNGHVFVFNESFESLKL